MKNVRKTGVYHFCILTISIFISIGFLRSENIRKKESIPEKTQKKVKIRTRKLVYSSREPIIVNFQGLPGNRFDLITIVPTSDPDNIIGIKTFTRRLKRGSFNFGTFNPGLYQVRIYFDWNKDKKSVVQARYTFTVKYSSRKKRRRTNFFLDH